MADTAEAFGVSRASIYKWIADGKLTGLRFGRVTRIPKTQVDQLLGEPPTDDPAEPNGTETP